jgi:hypothetical protein
MSEILGQSIKNNEGPPRELREILSDAIRYWQPRRILYNLVLAGVSAAWVVLTWPHFRGSLTPQSLLFLTVLAALANVCYCGAYLPDVFFQFFTCQSIWRRGRWTLWLFGTLFAVAVANYWIADEIYPYVR